MSQTSTLSPAGSPTGRNDDPNETDKFSKLAHRW